VDKTFLPLIIGVDVGAYAIAKSFHQEYGVKSVLVGRKPLGYTKYSSIIEKIHFKKDIQDDRVFVDFLKEIYDKYESKYENIVLIGSNDIYVSLIIKNKEELEKNFSFNYIDEKLHKKLYSKKKFYELCEKRDVAIPQTTFLKAREGLEGAKGFAHYPAIIKASNYNNFIKYSFPGQKKVYKINNEDDLDEVLRSIDASGFEGELILQEYIPGDDTYLRDIVCYINTKGEIELLSFAQVLSQERTVSGVGNYTALITREVPEIARELANFLTDQGYTGFANFDLKLDPRDQTYKVFEVNTRLGRASTYIDMSHTSAAKMLVDDLLFNGLKSQNEKVYVGPDKLFSYIPMPLLKSILKNNHSELMRKIENKKSKDNPLWYSGDWSIRRKILMTLVSLNYFKKYKENTSF